MANKKISELTVTTDTSGYFWIPAIKDNHYSTPSGYDNVRVDLNTLRGPRIIPSQTWLAHYTSTNKTPANTFCRLWNKEELVSSDDVWLSNENGTHDTKIKIITAGWYKVTMVTTVDAFDSSNVITRWPEPTSIVKLVIGTNNVTTVPTNPSFNESKLGSSDTLIDTTVPLTMVTTFYVYASDVNIQTNDAWFDFETNINVTTDKTFASQVAVSVVRLGDGATPTL